MSDSVVTDSIHRQEVSRQGTRATGVPGCKVERDVREFGYWSLAEKFLPKKGPCCCGIGYSFWCAACTISTAASGDLVFSSWCPSWHASHGQLSSAPTGLSISGRIPTAARVFVSAGRLSSWISSAVLVPVSDPRGDELDAQPKTVTVSESERT